MTIVKDSYIYGLASESQRRKRTLEELTGHQVLTVPGGEERPISDLVQVAVEKMVNSHSRLQHTADSQHIALDGIAAADIQNAVRVIRDGKPVLESRGKPKTLEEVRQQLAEIRACSEKFGQPSYIIRSGSAFWNSEGVATARMAMPIELDPKKLRALSDKDGFQEYVEAAGGSKTLLQISAGMMLEAFMRIKAVLKIGGQPVQGFNQRASERALKKALHVAGSGFSPEVLRYMHPEAHQMLLKAEWLQLLVNQSLDLSVPSPTARFH